METTILTIEGIVLEIVYKIHRGRKSGNYDLPDDPDELEIFEINHGGECVRDLLSESVKNEIESEIWANN